MSNSGRLVTDIVELMKHISTTPVIDISSRKGIALEGRRVRMRRRKQRTGQLLNKVKRHFS